MGVDLQKLRQVFTEAAGIDTPADQAAYLDTACEGDAELRAEVERLLKTQTRVGDFLEEPVIPPAEEPIGEGPGTVIGRYKILEQIGEGSFGLVFMAEQTEPVRRKVALKIIKAGMDTKAVVARFEAERQALALMDHPNVAQVFDADATETGRPFFVMELVKGIPITDYCDRHDLPMPERLELFVQVCRAVQHAHQKGIIHRDLKPANILVTMIDGEPVPKIIDFGVAKALGQQLTEKTLFTAFAQIIGTPVYMSPEQAEFSGVDVDTRSDIYSLGVLLYELLTGVTPFDAETLRRAGIDEIRRLIRETDPPKPSTRLHTLGEKLDEVARHRHVEPSALARLVHGDLDWIVMKALDKDRGRRYEAASALAQDIQQHLNHEPVLAGPPGTLYRTRKFVQRHRTGAVLSASVTVALVAGLVASSIGFAQARRERDRAVAAEAKAREEAAIAKAVKEFLQDDLLGQASPDQEPDRDVKLMVLVDRAAESVETRFQDTPLVEAEIRMTLFGVFRALGEYEKARIHVDRVLNIYREYLPADDPRRLRVRANLAIAYRDLGEYARAQELLEAVLPELRRVQGADHENTLSCLSACAGSYLLLGQLAEAAKGFEELVAGCLRARGPEDPLTLDAKLNLATVYQYQGKLAEAERLEEELLPVYQRVLGPEHPTTLALMSNLSNSCVEQGKYAEAHELLEQVLSIRQRVLGPEHPETLEDIGRLAVVYKAQGKVAEAREVLEQAISGLRRVLGPEHPDTLNHIWNLATMYDDPDKQLSVYQDLLPVWERLAGPGALRTLELKGNIAGAHAKAGRPAEAEKLLEEILPTVADLLGQEHPTTLNFRNTLAVAYRDQNRPGEAKSLLEEVLPAMRRVLGPEHPTALYTMVNLACCYGELGMRAEEARRFEEIAAIRRRILGEEHPETLSTMSHLAQVYYKLGRYREARELFEKVVPVQRRILGPEHEQAAWSMNELACLLSSCPDPGIRDGQSAVRWAQEVVAATGGTNANHVDTLAAAHAEAGEFDQAVMIQKQAISLLGAEGDNGYESRLRLYESGIPYRW